MAEPTRAQPPRVLSTLQWRRTGGGTPAWRRRRLGADGGQGRRLQVQGTPGAVLHFGEQGVDGEVDAEVGDDSDDRGSDAVQGGAEPLAVEERLDFGAPRKINRKQGT